MAAYRIVQEAVTERGETMPACAPTTASTGEPPRSPTTQCSNAGPVHRPDSGTDRSGWDRERFAYFTDRSTTGRLTDRWIRSCESGCRCG